MAKVKGSTAAAAAASTTTDASSSSSSSSADVKGKQPQYQGIGSSSTSSSSRLKGIGSSLSEYANKLKYGLYEKQQTSSPVVARRKSGGALGAGVSGGKTTSNTFKLLNWRTGSQTLAYYLVLMSFGFSIGAIGPSIPVLSYLSKTPLPSMGWIFTMRGIGAILGSLIGGKVYDSWYSKSKRGANLFLAASTLLLAACVALIPMASSYWYQLSIYFAFGVLGGLVNMGCNLLLIWMWEASVSGIILAMNAFSGIGSFLGAMFIARSASQFTSLYLSMAGVLLGAATFLALTQVSRLRTKGEYRALEEVTTTAEESEEEELEEELPASAEITTIEQQRQDVDQEGGVIDLDQEQEQELQQETSTMIGKKRGIIGKREWGTLFYNTSLALVVGVAMFGAVALETTFGGLITTYLRAKNIARSYEEVALMNASFWLSLTFSRLTAAVLSRWLKPGLILSLSINGVFGALAMFLLGPQMPVTGWLGSMLMGASVASMYPLALSYPETSMGVSMTGAMTTLMLVFASAAEMIIPITVTSSFRTVGADALFWTLLGVSISTFVAYSTMITWSFVKNLRAKPADTTFVEENESLIHGATTPESLKGTPVTPRTTPLSPIAADKRLATADELLFHDRTPQTPA